MALGDVPTDELVGWERPKGTIYCVGHKPAGDPIPLYAVEVDDDQCIVCGDWLRSEADRKGLLG